MELIRDWSSLSEAFPRSALAIGNFDGVHVGHQRIVQRLVDLSCETEAAAVVFTFEPHPAAILRPERAPDRLMTFERRLELFEAAGVDATVCPDGPLTVLAMPPEEFVRRIIVGAIGASVVVEGANFHFGRAQTGSCETLERMGREAGFRLEVVEPVLFEDGEVSSTRIRRAVAEGRVAEARQMLGRPFEFVGSVVHGRRRGRALGYPTVNLAGGDFLVPGDGVYAGRARVREPDAETYGEAHDAAISVGRAATFGELAQSVVEAYLLDFEDELYDRRIRVEFVERIRDQRTFPTAEALAAEMARDCREVRRILSRNAGA